MVADQKDAKPEPIRRLIKLIKNHLRLSYAGTVCQAELIPEAIKRTSVDLLFINPNMLQIPARNFIRSIKVQFSHLELVIFTNQNSPLLSQLIQLDLTGYLLKTDSSDTLLRALERIANNQVYYSQDIIKPAFRSIRRMGAELELAKLTKCERRILPLVAQKLTNDKIAQKLNLSAGTVRTHLNHIHNKLGYQSRQEAIEHASWLTSNLEL